MLDMLMHARLSLLNPSTWVDQNDREVMAHFAGTIPGRRVLACCMATGNETAHHWQIFADRGLGACVVFDRGALIAAVKADPNVEVGDVGYVNWKDLKGWGTYRRLPFIKRQVFRFEREFRVIATPLADASNERAYYVPIPLSCITSVVVSGEVPPAHFETLKEIIRSFPGCARLRVRHSGLLRNQRWSETLLAQSS